MKFPILAATCAIILAASAEAACSLNVYSAPNEGGHCNNFDILAYETCYTTSAIYGTKSIQYNHDDPSNNEISLTLYESGNCGGKWTRASLNIKAGEYIEFDMLENVSGRVGSVLLHKGLTSNANGHIDQYLVATTANFKGKCTYRD